MSKKYELSYYNVNKSITNRLFRDYFNRLSLKARCLFKWNNLPNGIDEKWIEEYLFYNGKCVFFKDKSKGFMITGFTDKDRRNYYNEPTKIYASSIDYQNASLENNINAIIIRNNDDMIPTERTIQIYAYKLTNLDMTIENNLELQKMPYIITCSDKQKLSFKVLMDKKRNNEPVIYADKDIDLNSVNAIKTETPFIVDKLQVQKHEIFNECNTFLGINNANVSKRERLITNEVDANNDDIEANFDVMLKARQKACELINQMFKLNISVERRSNDNFINVVDNGDDNND